MVIRAVKGFQPPSGGCVLKQVTVMGVKKFNGPAAFGRLCVETGAIRRFFGNLVPAAFGRLCVETNDIHQFDYEQEKPAAFGRLCVETTSLDFG